jgi:short-subunit dehydrogenase
VIAAFLPHKARPIRGLQLKLWRHALKKHGLPPLKSNCGSKYAKNKLIMKIKNQVVVITGSSAGLGRALAHRYAKSGAKIALLARSKESLATTEKELQVFGVETMSVSTDVSNSDQVEEAAKKITVRFGKIDTWINCAMVSVFSPVKEMTAEEYKRVTEVNYLGTVNGTLSALKVMLPQKRGTIIQVGSALSKRSIPLQSAYCATKHAINGFTEALRCELLHDKSPVKVVRVQLPAMNTPQFAG